MPTDTRKYFEVLPRKHFQNFEGFLGKETRPEIRGNFCGGLRFARSKENNQPKSALQSLGINLCDKDFAELSRDLSGAICLKTLVLLVMPGGGSTTKQINPNLFVPKFS